jgi:hypothetical protein
MTGVSRVLRSDTERRTFKVHSNRPKLLISFQIDMRLETLLVLSVTCVAAIFAADFTVKKYEDTPGLSFNHIGQVQLYGSEWKLVTYVNISKLETTYNTLVDAVSQTRAMCKELPPAAISTCQSDLSAYREFIVLRV